MKRNFKKHLKKNQIILTYVNTAISITAIIVSILGLSINSKVQKYQEYEAFPSFKIISKQRKGTQQDQLINVKGFVNNLSFKKFELMTILLPDTTIRISYQCYSTTQEKEHNKWLIDSPCKKEVGNKVKSSILRLQNSYHVEINNIYVETYYEILYQDYQNAERVNIYNRDDTNNNIIRAISNDHFKNIGIHTMTIKDWSEERVDDDAKAILKMIEYYQNQKRNST